MTEQKKPFEGILSSEETMEISSSVHEDASKFLRQTITYLHRTLRKLLDGEGLPGRLSRKIALQLLHGELKGKETMTTNALTPQAIVKLIREGQRVILSPVDHSPDFMEMEVRDAYGSRFKRDSAWYRANKADLLKQYEGQYIMIYNCQVVDSDNDKHVLVERSYAEPYRDQEVLIQHVVKEEPVVHV